MAAYPSPSPSRTTALPSPTASPVSSQACKGKLQDFSAFDPKTLEDGPARGYTKIKLMLAIGLLCSRVMFSLLSFCCSLVMFFGSTGELAPVVKFWTMMFSLLSFCCSLVMFFGSTGELASVVKFWTMLMGQDNTWLGQDEKAHEGSHRFDSMLDSICDQDHKDKVTFFFVKAERIRQATEAKLPCFQELLDRGWLEEVSCSPEQFYHGEFVKEVVAISHRWEDAQDPDPDGTQFACIQKFITEDQVGKDANLVWYDFWFIPQGQRTTSQNRYFQSALDNMDMLYLGAQVLLVVDMAYASRFWTEFEAWLSMQACSDRGLEPTSNDRRSHIACIHNATQTLEGQKLLDMWENKTPSQAYDALKLPDVAVTNRKDKDSKLLLIQKINEEVAQNFSVKHAEKLLKAKKLNVQKLNQKGFSFERLFEAARGVGFTAPQFKEAGFTAGQLKEAGFTDSHLKEAGFKAGQLKEEGFTAGQLNEGGFTAGQLKETGFTIEQLKDGGFPVKQLKKAGFKARDLEVVGLTRTRSRWHPQTQLRQRRIRHASCASTTIAQR